MSTASNEDAPLDPEVQAMLDRLPPPPTARERHLRGDFRDEAELQVPAHDLMLHAHPHDRPHVEPHEHPHQHREGWTHSHRHFHAEPDDEFRQQSAEFMDRNDELLRRLASSDDGDQR
jgi:hypothetical protein